MLIEALCLNDAFESTQCIYYEKGKTYQIDPDSEIGRMTVRPLSSGKVDPKTGEIVPAKVTRALLPVFQFDRAMPSADGVQAPKRDYSCKDCGKKFKSLNELGNHANAEHREEPFEDGTEEEPVAAQTFLCKQCDPAVAFDSRAKLQSHKYKDHGLGVRFKKKEEATAAA